MSYTDNVAEFMDSVSELDGVDVDDLEAVAPEAIKKVRSQPNSPFGKETHSTLILQTKKILRMRINTPIFHIQCDSRAHSFTGVESNSSRITEWHRKRVCQFPWTYQRKRCTFTKWSFQCCWTFRRWVHRYCGGDVLSRRNFSIFSIDAGFQMLPFLFQDDTNLNDEPNVRYSRPWTRRLRAQSPDSPSITTTHVRHCDFSHPNSTPG